MGLMHPRVRITGWKEQRAERAREGKHEHMNDGIGVHGAAESRVPDMGPKDPTRQTASFAWSLAGSRRDGGGVGFTASG